MNTPTVCVTGATGLVGSHVVYDLLQKGCCVKALKRAQSNTGQVLKTFARYTADADALFRKIEWMEGDLLDYPSMCAAIDGCAQVYHTAAVVSFSRSDQADMMRINVEGTANMVNVCLERSIPLCHVSSIGALGRSNTDGRITENDLWQTAKGRSVYAYSKHKAEMEVWRGIAEGLRAVIVNPAIILGPGDWTKGSAKFFPQVYRGMRFHTPGVTAFVDVRDVSRCMLQLMERECFGERYILTAGDLSYRELFHLIADGLHVKRPTIAARPWMLKTACCLSWLACKLTGKVPVLTKEMAHSAFRKIRYSNEKINKTLGYKFISPEKSVEDGCKYFLCDQRLYPKNI
jgi:nucleoside-diphosphate-sugar epimerase